MQLDALRIVVPDIKSPAIQNKRKAKSVYSPEAVHQQAEAS